MTQEDRQRYSSAAGSAGLQASGAGTAKKSDILPARPLDAAPPPPSALLSPDTYMSLCKLREVSPNDSSSWRAV